MTGENVYLFQYDLTNGLARGLSLQLIGRQIDAVWHTSVVVFGREYYFGAGISEGMPGATQFGAPHERLLLGRTQLPKPLFMEYLSQLRQDRFSATSYNLLLNNCNHFSDMCAQFLVGRGIPQEILDLPRIALSSPMGPMLSQMLSVVTNVAEPVQEPEAVEDATAAPAVPNTADDEAFAAAVKAEYEAILAEGGHSNESASELAVTRVVARGL